MIAPAVVLWDLDGTLLVPPSSGVFPRAMALLGLPVVHLVLPHGLTDYGRAAALLKAARASRSRLPDLLAVADDLTRDESRDWPTAPMPGAGEALSRLRDFGLIQGILTGNTYRRMLTKLDSAGLGTSWSDPAMIFTGEGELDRASLGRRARRAAKDALLIVIGDSDEDVRTARAARARFYRVGKTSSPNHVAKGIVADLGLRLEPTGTEAPQ